MNKQINLKKVIKIIDKVTDGILLMFFILCLLIGIYISYDSYYVYSQASSERVSEFKPIIVDENSANTDSLKKLSDDVVGWLTIDNTSIDYPIMQGSSNIDYLNTDSYGEFSLSGSIFVDSANSEDFTDSFNLIYGHHMDHQYMFGALDNYRKESFGNSHCTGRIITVDGKVIELNLLAVVEGLTTDYTVFDVTYANKEPSELSEYIYEHNIYIYNNELNEQLENTRIFALSTCTSTASQERLIVFFAEVN